MLFRSRSSRSSIFVGPAYQRFHAAQMGEALLQHRIARDLCKEARLFIRPQFAIEAGIKQFVGDRFHGYFTRRSGARWL